MCVWMRAQYSTPWSSASEVVPHTFKKITWRMKWFSHTIRNDSKSKTLTLLYFKDISIMHAMKNLNPMINSIADAYWAIRMVSISVFSYWKNYVTNSALLKYLSLHHFLSLHQHHCKAVHGQMPMHVKVKFAYISVIANMKLKRLLQSSHCKDQCWS